MSCSRLSIIATTLLTLAALTGCQSDGSPQVATAPQWNHYGEKITYATQSVSLGSLKGDESDITISGVITEVCTHQGCWIRLKDPANPDAGDLFVRTKGHAYLVPLNCKGRNALVHGRCEFSEMSVDEQKHYADEAGHSEAEIAKITQPKRMITFHADSIMIEGEGLAKPLDQ